MRESKRNEQLIGHKIGTLQTMLANLERQRANLESIDKKLSDIDEKNKKERIGSLSHDEETSLLSVLNAMERMAEIFNEIDKVELYQIVGSTKLTKSELAELKNLLEYVAVKKRNGEYKNIDFEKNTFAIGIIDTQLRELFDLEMEAEISRSE